MDISAQRKTLRNPTENVYISTVGSNVSDAYFYHELSRTCGSDIAYLWIHAQLSAKSNKCNTGSSTTCTPNRSPMNSAPTTPRGRSAGMAFPPTHRSVQIKEEVCGNSKDVVKSTEESSADRYKAEYQITAAKNTHLDPATAAKSNGNNIGLLYTDAAHTVLDS
jgi:hypothetical protein